MTRILIVDDDAAVRSVASQALTEDGYQVDAGNGQQALAAFREHRPDALVLTRALMRTLRERAECGASASDCGVRH